jgi:hypothetical protein
VPLLELNHTSELAVIPKIMRFTMQVKRKH